VDLRPDDRVFRPHDQKLTTRWGNRACPLPVIPRPGADRYAGALAGINEQRLLSTAIARNIKTYFFMQNPAPSLSVATSQPPPRTKAELLAITRSLPDSAFFQEHSRVRELAYIERSFSRWTEIIDVARRYLPNLEKLACLDVGVSPFTFRLKTVFGQVFGLDLSDSFRDRCESFGIVLHGGGVTSTEALARIDKVDCVFCLEVLEHLHADPVRVLAGLRSVLRPGGLLILTTPNMMCFANRVLMLCNRKLRHFDYPPFSIIDEAHGFGHDRIYMPAELREYFAWSGFQQVKTLYQYHINDMAHHDDTTWQRIVSIGPAIIKRLMPPMRDGIIMVGRNP
jgi:SAM-dependent methyltransferase